MTRAQKVSPFTGEGAYHGSTKPRAAAPPPELVDEMRPLTIEGGVTTIGAFEARFPNLYEPLAQLPVPLQAAIQNDGVTFVWTPFDQALKEAGPLTKSVLAEMQKHLVRTKRRIYVDSKIQWFEKGDVPVDSRHWHVDGSITTRGPKVEALGFSLLHDMKARMTVPGPVLLSYQSSSHCATEFLTEPLVVTMQELIPNFDALDDSVRALAPPATAQPAASIVRFDGLSLHRAVAATDAGWRLWVRVMETDRLVTINPSIVECYNSVFRPQ